jgi:ankyrin repeat protein
LIEAAKRGDLERVRALVSGDPALMNVKDRDYGATALHWAALRGQAPVVSFLIASGADTAVRNAEGETALEVARRAGKKEVVALLER